MVNLDGSGITLHAWPFPDGDPPSPEIISDWMKLVSETMNVNKKDSESRTIALHCVAGLGRSPVMAAVALIEFGLEWQEAVELIRAKRRGAINRKQLKYLESYIPTSRNTCCVIS